MKDQFYQNNKIPAVVFFRGLQKQTNWHQTCPRNERKAATATPGSPPMRSQVPRPCKPLQKTPTPKLVMLCFDLKSDLQTLKLQFLKLPQDYLESVIPFTTKEQKRLVMPS